MSTSLNWSKRVPLERIKRLYLSDAHGLLDTELLDQIGHNLYSRCSDIFEFWRACNGEVTCRHCGRTIRRRGHITDAKGDLTELLRCRCGWQIAWGDYLRRSQGHQLGASDVQLLVQHFMAHWPKCKTSQDKLLLIDWLIHQFHIKMVGERATIHLNGKLVVDNCVMENVWEKEKPIYSSGQIELQHHGNPLYFRNIFIKEL